MKKKQTVNNISKENGVILHDIFVLTEKTNHVDINKASINTTLKINNVSTKVRIDSGSSIDVIDKGTYSKINKDNKIKLKKTKK